jgi:hypothetical protein
MKNKTMKIERLRRIHFVYNKMNVYTIEDLKWDKVPLNPRATLPINELEGTQSVPLYTIEDLSSHKNTKIKKSKV